MTINREVLEKLLCAEENLLAETVLLTQRAQPEHDLDRDWRHYQRALKRNVTRIHRMLSNAESFWMLGVQHVS